MNGGVPVRPPFFGAVPNMTQQTNQPPGPFYPNVPPPNFSVPPPGMGPGGPQFPRFSGPMHNQPTFNQGVMAGGNNVQRPPPPLPSMNMPPPVYNISNNQGPPPFNHVAAGQWANCAANNNVQPQFPNNQQRQMPNFQNDIFSDAPKEIPNSFPHFKPMISAPLQQQQNRGGFHHQGNNTVHNNNNVINQGAANHSYKTNNNNNNYNNNNKPRGGFNGGSNNRGRGNFNNNKGRGGYNNNHNNNNNSNNGAQKKKEPKVDKRDLPENNAFYCDTCDRGFKTEDKYREHVDQHQKCTYKDCPFVAAPKLVQLHINMQHRAGLASQIYGVKSEEEVKKWKDERRKNYPTAENRKKKQEKQEERIARGEVIDTKEFGKMKGQNGGRGRDRGRGRRGGRFGRGRDDSCDTSRKQIIDVNDDDDDGPPEERKIKRSNKEDTEGVDLTEITDSDDQSNHGKKAAKRKGDVVDLTKSSSDEKCVKKDVPSLALVSGYGKGSDESSSDSETATGAKSPVNGDGNKFGLVSGNKGSDTQKDVDLVPTPAGPNKTTTTVSENSVGTAGTTEASSRRSEVKGTKRGHMTKGGGPDNKRPKFTAKPLPKSHTLLEKLLANEIRRERNKILQCVHFIVKNKFFDKPVVNEGSSN